MLYNCFKIGVQFNLKNLNHCLNYIFMSYLLLSLNPLQPHLNMKYPFKGYKISHIMIFEFNHIRFDSWYFIHKLYLFTVVGRIQKCKTLIPRDPWSRKYFQIMEGSRLEYRWIYGNYQLRFYEWPPFGTMTAEIACLEYYFVKTLYIL